MVHLDQKGDPQTGGAISCFLPIAATCPPRLSRHLRASPAAQPISVSELVRLGRAADTNMRSVWMEDTSLEEDTS
jgi:hypothetical protein